MLSQNADLLMSVDLWENGDGPKPRAGHSRRGLTHQIARDDWRAEMNPIQPTRNA